MAVKPLQPSQLNLSGVLPLTGGALTGATSINTSSISEEPLTLVQSGTSSAVQLVSKGNGYLGWLGKNTLDQRRFAFEQNPARDFSLFLYDDSGNTPRQVWAAYHNDAGVAALESFGTFYAPRVKTPYLDSGFASLLITTVLGTNITYTNASGIMPATTGVMTLGDPTHYWLSGNISTLNLNATASISGATAGKLSITGELVTTGGVTTGPATGFGLGLSLVRDGAQVGRIDNNQSGGGGMRVQAMTGNLQLRGSGNTGILIDASGNADFAAKITTVGGITTRVSTTASSATPTPTGDSSDMYTVTALAAAATFAAPTGTPTDGQKLLIRIKDNGTARTLAWNAIYVAGPAALLTTTVINKTHLIGFVYDSTAVKWVAVAADAAGY